MPPDGCGSTVNVNPLQDAFVRVGVGSHVEARDGSWVSFSIAVTVFPEAAS